MTFLRGVVTQVFGLFVDDGSLALAILGWVVAAAGVVTAGLLPSTLVGLALFLGLAVLLVENVLRRGRNQEDREADAKPLPSGGTPL